MVQGFRVSFRENNESGAENAPFFDAAYYLAQNPDVAAAVERGETSAWEHFAEHGIDEGRNPSIFFNVTYYLNNNPDIAASGQNAFDHFMDFGQFEGRDPSALFDTNYYLEKNPDVAHSVEYGQLTAFQHFMENGINEIRSPSSSFDPQHYITENPDVAASGLSPLMHYIEYGQYEGRSPNAHFDPEYYEAKYGNDLGGLTPFEHFISVGQAQGVRTSSGSVTPNILDVTNLNTTEAYTEDVALNLTDMVIATNADTVTATLTLSSNSVGSLSTGTSGTVTSTYNAGTGVWVASGNYADVNILLAGLTFTPTADYNDNFTIAIDITSDKNKTVTGTFTLNGTPVNDAVTLASTISDQANDTNAAYSYDASVHFSDIDAADGDTLTYSITDIKYGTGSPSGWGDTSAWTVPISIDATTGIITGTPNTTETVYITVTATDDGAVSVSETFELFVANTGYTVGTAGSDTYTLTADTVYWGYGGNDTITGDDNRETIHGGDGDDVIAGSTGNSFNFDVIFGGAGNDTISGYATFDSLYGGDGDDSITSSYAYQYQYGQAGNDSMLGGAWWDVLDGGDGDDTLNGQANSAVADTLTGGSGSDTFVFSSVAHSMDGESDLITDFVVGTDTIKLSNIPIGYIQGDSATEAILTMAFDGTYTTLSHDLTSFSIKLTGDYTATLTSADFIFDNQIGSAGGDVITAGATYTSIFGYGGNDTITGDDNGETIHGGDGDDVIAGSTGNSFNADVIFGGAGNDTISGYATFDSLYGGDGDDSITSSYAYQYQYGQAGNDSMLGGAWWDVLDGGDGDDTLNGQGNNNAVADTLTGGTGSDNFVFSNLTDSTNAAADEIVDWEDGSDTINLTGLGFTDISDFETFDYNTTLAGKTILWDTDSNFAISFSTDVTGVLDNTDFVF